MIKEFAPSPILFKEFRSQLRGARAAMLLTVYIGLALLAMRLVYNTMAGQLDGGNPIFSAQIGQALFIGLALTVQTLTIFLAPAATVNAVSSEHERRTYDLILATPLSATSLLLGKLLAALAFVLLLTIATVPLFSIVILFGGVGWSDIVRVVLTLVSTTVVGTLLGMLCSIITRQTYSATLLCYALLIAVIGGTLFSANLWSMSRAGQAAPPSYLVLNPLSAMATALGRARPPEIVTAETLQPLVILSLLTQGTVVNINTERVVLPLYRATALIYLGISLAIFWISLHAIQPRRRWKWSRADVFMLAFVLIYITIGFISREWWMAGLAVE